MAHHQKHQMDARRRSSAMQSLLKMFSLSNAPTVPLDDEESSAESDEPPDEPVSPLTTVNRDVLYSKSMAPPPNPHRESLLTRAIMAESKHDDLSPTSAATPRGLSTTSSHSTASMASTAELTSDGDVTSPSRSTTPSPPPPPPGRLPHLLGLKKPNPPASKVIIAPITKDDKPAVAEVGEAAIEKTLGRKRRIMFACGGNEPEKSRDKVSSAKETPAEPEAPKRKCMLTFACPTRTNSKETRTSPTDFRGENTTQRRSSPAPVLRRRSNAESVDLSGRSSETAKLATVDRPRPNQPSLTATFYEFGGSHDETDSWVDRPSIHREKLTVDDCMRKENHIRQLGQEAAEEAEEEEREQEELEDEFDDNEAEDDFAPSEDGSDAGNESDDEEGFANSDDESDAGSEYQFWAPSTTTAATSVERLNNISHFSSRRRSEASSVESVTHSGSPPLRSMRRHMGRGRTNPSKMKMRPGTPELPDSTDFVCGTLDEDRPLEAAYISCREQKKREKHVPIPQDIDPSFPTTDPDDNDNETDEDEMDESQHSSDGPHWLKDQFAGFEDDNRGRVKSPTVKSPSALISAQAPHITFAGRPDGRRGTHRSPPPRHMNARSPPPRKLFGHSPTRMRSPPPPARLRSPRGSPTNVNIPIGIGMRGLAQRPMMERTASLPDTPNPFFKNFKIGSPSISNIASGAVTPAVEEARPDMHVRGPVDIVIGLEKKREKRKEKYRRQHCRKAAKEQAERKPIPGRGAERMKELGLECAERIKGYGIGQQTQLVISL